MINGSSQKMRVLYVTDHIYLHGGAEKILIQKLNYWADVYNYDVCLVTTQQKGLKPFYPLSEKVLHKDLGINYIEGVSFYSKANFSQFPVHFKKLKEAIASFAPDAVFVISQTLSRYITPFATSKAKTFYEYHTSYYGFELGQRNLGGFKKIKAKLIGAIAALAESFYTKVVFLNQSEFDHYKRGNSVIVPNFYDTIPVSDDRPRRNVAISLGRLSYQKGYDLLMDAWSLLDGAVDGWSLEIYGNGDDRAALEKKLVSMNFRNPVLLMPAIDNVNEKLAESAFYVMSSRYETFPMVLLEAMSNKLPIVSFDCPTGPRSMVIDGQDGILVPGEDIAALAGKMLLLMRDPQLCRQMGEMAFKNVKRFNPEAVMGQWDRLIRDK